MKKFIKERAGGLGTPSEASSQRLALVAPWTCLLGCSKSLGMNGTRKRKGQASASRKVSVGEAEAGGDLEKKKSTIDYS